MCHNSNIHSQKNEQSLTSQIMHYYTAMKVNDLQPHIHKTVLVTETIWAKSQIHRRWCTDNEIIFNKVQKQASYYKVHGYLYRKQKKNLLSKERQKNDELDLGKWCEDDKAGRQNGEEHRGRLGITNARGLKMSDGFTGSCFITMLASLVAQLVKCLPAVQETWVWSLGREDPLEKEMATHSSTLAWTIPWMEEPGRLQSMGSKTVRHNWATSLSSHTHIRHQTFTEYHSHPWTWKIRLPDLTPYWAGISVRQSTGLTNSQLTLINPKLGRSGTPAPGDSFITCTKQ